MYVVYKHNKVNVKKKVFEENIDVVFNIIVNFQKEKRRKNVSSHKFWESCWCCFFIIIIVLIQKNKSYNRNVPIRCRKINEKKKN